MCICSPFLFCSFLKNVSFQHFLTRHVHYVRRSCRRGEDAKKNYHAIRHCLRRPFHICEHETTGHLQRDVWDMFGHVFSGCLGACSIALGATKPHILDWPSEKSFNCVNGNKARHFCWDVGTMWGQKLGIGTLLNHLSGNKTSFFWWDVGTVYDWKRLTRHQDVFPAVPVATSGCLWRDVGTVCSSKLCIFTTKSKHIPAVLVAIKPRHWRDVGTMWFLCPTLSRPWPQFCHNLKPKTQT